MQEKSLKHRLMIIVSYLFVLPSLVVCYIFYDKHVTLSLSHVALFFLILVLAIIGIILVRYVFPPLPISSKKQQKVAKSYH
jgi:hypothetical protein